MPFAVTGCLDDMRSGEIDNIYSEIEVQITLPVLPDGVVASVENLEVVVSNASKTRAITYTARTDAAGVARLTVEKGIYDVKCQSEVTVDGNKSMLLGVKDKLDVTKNADTEVKMILAFHVGELIIKEAYFSGCKNNAGSNYSADQYVIIYNNSDKVQYLDEMGLATSQDLTGLTAASAWKPVFDLGLVPLYQFTFSFPTDDTGMRFPLQPGEQAVVCINAIDHTGVASESVNLAKEGYFALYYEGFKTQSIPNSEAGVITMDLINASGSINFYTMMTTAPAFVLYKIDGMTPQAYKATTGAIRPKPGTTTPECLVIDKRWILDGIEFGLATTKFARLPIEVNGGPGGIPTDNTTLGSGNAWRRKVKGVIDGRTIYVDTNNTKEDFEVVTPSLKE